ncbi:cisplatin damage response ATP-dependent DNA ligase [Legionella sp. WA2024007413]
MKKFAQLLNQLFFTYGGLDKRTLIEHYFSVTPDPERGYALAIMTNSLKFSRFKRSLIKNLISENIDPTLFYLSYDYVGDLSETVSLIWPDTQNQSELPLLSEIIVNFEKLPENDLYPYLVSLLNSSDSIERWAILKIITGDLRIGVSTRFLKNTLAHYGQLHVQEVEDIWHSQVPPYLELFSWLEKKSSKPSTNTLYFRPVMLSHPLNESERIAINLNEFSIEKKYDGIRVQLAVSGKEKALYTRTGENISHSFPEIISKIEGNVVLDGELVIRHASKIGSFNDLQQRLNRKTLSKKLLEEQSAALIVYDILFIDNLDLRVLPFLNRREWLEQWFSTSAPENFLISPLLSLKNTQTLHQLREEILQENSVHVEGLMLKKKSSLYLAGRPKGCWYKWKKDPYIIDAILMYAQRGHGKRSSYYSDYTFGLWKLNQLLPIGKAYFGFTDEELYQLDKWIRSHTLNRFGPVREVEKELVLEIAFDAVHWSNRHKSGVALRFPRINRIRWDKPAHEADQLETLKKLIRT